MMISDGLERGIIGEAGLALVPEALRHTMLQDAEFLDAFGQSMRMEGIVSFSDGIRLKTTTLFDAVAEADNRARGKLGFSGEFPRPYFSGPLEGGFPPPQGLPGDAKQVIDEQLSLPELTTKSFIASINLANMYAIEEELALRISERLKSGKYHFQETQSDEEFAAVLSGLAVLAAVTRSQELANDVRILVRKYRRDPAHKISMRTACRSVFFAAAANQGLEGWCRCIGDAVDELVFGALTRDEASILQSLIRRTCEAEPVLWTSIGAAGAALSTYHGS